MLTRSKTPVFIFGSQALLPPVSADELRKAVETIGVPCFLGKLRTMFLLNLFKDLLQNLLINTCMS